MDGVRATTPENIVFGAGTIHKGLEYSSTSSSWNFEDSIIGATQGGSTLTITPEYKDIEADGVHVKTQGLLVKTGEVATLQTTFLELNEEILGYSAMGEKVSVTDVTGFSKIVSKEKVEEGDYIENLAFVGETLDGKKVIVIFPLAKCTSGVELNGTNKNEATISATFECYAPIEGNHKKLDWIIYLED